MANTQLNYLLPSKATLSIYGLPEFSLQVQNFKIPRVYGFIAEQPTPNLSVPLPGNKLIYNILEVAYIVSEDMENWRTVLEWMEGIYAPIRSEQFRDKKLYMQDADLTVYTSANNPYMKIKFIDMFPVKVDEIIFDMANPSAEPIQSKIEFAYNRFEVEML